MAVAGRWLMALVLGALLIEDLAANDPVSIRLASFQAIRFTPVPGVRPFFLVGTDSVSRDWLQANASFFADRSAMGYVIDADSTAAVESLRKISGYRWLLPLEQPESLIREYGLTAYPVFVEPGAGTAIQ